MDPSLQHSSNEKTQTTEACVTTQIGPHDTHEEVPNTRDKSGQTKMDPKPKNSLSERPKRLIRRPIIFTEEDDKFNI